MKTDTIEKLVWVAIYGGMILGGFGLAVRQAHDPAGWTLIVLGAVSIVVGLALIVLRSRIPKD
jgi:sulfite exporter TauE/SafE